MKLSKIRNFTNGWVGVVLLHDNMKIETTSTCLPKSTEIRITGKQNNATDINLKDMDLWNEKWCIGVSTQSGCPIKCKFCAVNKLTEKQGFRNLTSKEIFDQVEMAIKHTLTITNKVKSPNDSEIFRVLFTRMGEPSLNIDNVIDGIRLIKDKYPMARIQISTIGISQSYKLVNELMKLETIYGKDWLELQFSIHSSDNSYRKWLQNKLVIDNKELGELIKYYYNSIPNRPWKVTLNFALSENTPFVPSDLLTQFDKDTVFIKISPINENVSSDESGIKTLFHYKNNI